MATKLKFLVAKLKVVLALATVSVAILSPGFNGFITSSACVHNIMEQADDASKFLGLKCASLLATL